jgi:hypothetical protein
MRELGCWRINLAVKGTLKTNGRLHREAWVGKPSCSAVSQACKYPRIVPTRLQHQEVPCGPDPDFYVPIRIFLLDFDAKYCLSIHPYSLETAVCCILIGLVLHGGLAFSVEKYPSG